MIRLPFFILALAMTGSFAAQAHPSISGQVIIGDGPLHLGIDLGHWHGRHHWPGAHQHGAGCYRRFPQHHWHWSDQPTYQHRPRHERRHDHRHGPTQHHRHGSHRHRYPGSVPTHRPSHRPGPAGDRHRHARDCYLHYPRDHDHWKH